MRENRCIQGVGLPNYGEQELRWGGNKITYVKLLHIMIERFLESLQGEHARPARLRIDLADFCHAVF